MSLTVASLNLATAAVGQSFTVAWTGDVKPIATSPALATSAEAPKAHLRIFNESGCGFDLTSNTGRQDYVPAGGWPIYAVDATEATFTLVVDGIFPGGTVNVLKAILYQPGEAVPPAPVLGNSPVGIGGTVSTSTANAVINDGNVAPTVVVEATPSGGSSSLKFNNDGSGFFGGGLDVVNAAGKFTAMPLDAIPVGAVGPGALDTDVTVGAAQVQPGTFPNGEYGFNGGTNGAAMNVTATNAQGARVIFLSSVSSVGNNADLLDMQRIVGGATVGQFTFGIDSVNNQFYIFDALAGKFIFEHSAATAVNADNSGSVTTPQIQTGTAGAGLGVKDNKASGFIELYPTETDATARGIQLDYIDAAGALHAAVQISNAGSFLSPFAGGDVFRVSSFFSGGGGGGTFTHGLHGTPSWVGITCDVANSSETVGVDTIGSTTVHVTLGAALAFIGMATR